MAKAKVKRVRRGAIRAVKTQLQAAIDYCARQTGNVMRVGRIAYEEPRRMARGTIYGIGVLVERALQPVLVRVVEFKSVRTCGHKVALAWVRHHDVTLGWVPVDCLGRVGMTEVYSYLHGTHDMRVHIRAIEAGVDITSVQPNLLPTDGRNECGFDGQWQE